MSHTAYTAYAESLAPAAAYIPHLLAPRWPSPVGVLDLYSAHRLSVVVHWIAGGGGRGLLAELVGLMVVLFGGETFLCMCSGAPPSWLLNPTLALVFGGIHVLQTRTPLRALLPRKPGYRAELLLSIPDAIGRTLLLTRFAIVPLLRPASGAVLPATPSTLILVPFILAVPFSALTFGTNFFGGELRMPAELREWGWTAVDVWLPVVLPIMFCSLIGPVKGWETGLGVSEEAATVVCAVFTSVCFLVRTWWNLAPRKVTKAKRARAKKVKNA